MIVLLVTTVILIALGICVVILHNFPWVLGKTPKISYLKLSCSDTPILIVSDLHLGNKKSLGLQIIKVILRYRVRTMIIAGDLIDKRLALSRNILNLLKRFMIKEIRKIIFVPSSSSHDFEPLPENPVKEQEDDYTVWIIPYVAWISIEKCVGDIYVTHGDYISRNGIIAHLLDVLSQKIFSKPFIGLILRKILKIRNVDWVVHGHSHTALYSEKYRVVRTGCWVRRPHELIQRAFVIAICRNRFTEIKLFKL